MRMRPPRSNTWTALQALTRAVVLSRWFNRAAITVAIASVTFNLGAVLATYMPRHAHASPALLSHLSTALIIPGWAMYMIAGLAQIAPPRAGRRSTRPPRPGMAPPALLLPDLPPPATPLSRRDRVTRVMLTLLAAGFLAVPVVIGLLDPYFKHSPAHYDRITGRYTVSELGRQLTLTPDRYRRLQLTDVRANASCFAGWEMACLAGYAALRRNAARKRDVGCQPRFPSATL